MRREKEKISDELIEELEKMVALLRLDVVGTWTSGFEGFLLEALELKRTGYPERGIRDLCGSVRSVFGGMGSFNDYFPKGVDNGKFVKVSDRIYEMAEEIQVVKPN